MPLLARGRSLPPTRLPIPLSPAVEGATERTCGSPACRNGWLPPWKNRRRPIFEGEWGCSSRCLRDLVSAAVRREGTESSGSQAFTPHRHRVPLGLVLLAQGWITHPQLRQALEAQRSTGTGRIGDWLTQSCGIQQERITRGLGVQWNCPVLATDSFSPRAMALVMPKRLVGEFGILPLRVAGSSLLYLAFEEQRNSAVALGVERMSGLHVESGLLPAEEFESARASLLQADAAPVAMKLVADGDALVGGILRTLEDTQPMAARLVRIHQYFWLRTWLEAGALSGPGQLPPSPEDVQDTLFVASDRLSV